MPTLVLEFGAKWHWQKLLPEKSKTSIRFHSNFGMGKKIVFGDDDEVTTIPTLPDEQLMEANEESSDDDVVEETASSAPFKRGYMADDDSDDSDEAPEEVSVSTSKGKTMELYEVQKNAAKQYILCLDVDR